MLIYIAALGFEVGFLSFKSDASYSMACAHFLIGYMKLGDILVQSLESNLNCKLRMQEKIKSI